jgi:multiple sugar transport system permease protein
MNSEAGRGVRFVGETLLQQASAATILLTLPVNPIAFVAQKYLVAGLNSGAVKG